ncbi:MAG: DUF2142 domain-containing protein [Verrucomicrobiae bacterium]|nr:DUF2142 domain-containing protein [Verrucomicrobiae bacterium]
MTNQNGGGFSTAGGEKPVWFETLFCRNERTVIHLLCLFVAVRLFVFCAGFPLFSSVDEQAHFDTVYKYARGYLPRKGVDLYDPGAAVLIALHDTPEIFGDERECPDGKVPPPMWRWPPSKVETVGQTIILWQKCLNHESASPPLYYGLAGAWLDLGRLSGQSGGSLVYWVRFFNMGVMVFLTWYAHVFVRRHYPDRVFLRFGVPCLIAFFPQDIFYSMNADILSAPLFAAALDRLIRVFSPECRKSDVFAAGVFCAMALLTKLTNIVMLPVILLAGTMAARTPESRRLSVHRCLAVFGMAFLIFGVWLGWNEAMLGDWWATRDKMRMVGVIERPVTDWWRAPVLQPHYFVAFIWETLISFWRGSFVWFGKTIASPSMDVFYAISTLLLVPIGFREICFRRKGEGTAMDRQAGRMTGWLLAGVLVLFMGLLMLLSLRLGYRQGCRAAQIHPPFTADGRFMLGALIPFAIFYLAGLEALTCRWFRCASPYLLLFVMVAGITCGEVLISAHVFSSPYNWFHLTMDAPFR